MNTRILLGAGLAALFLSAGAYAATPAPADQCIAPTKQFDQEVMRHSTALKVDEAKSLRSDAGKMCQSAKYDDAIKKLKQALEDIGVKPQS